MSLNVARQGLYERAKSKVKKLFDKDYRDAIKYSEKFNENFERAVENKEKSPQGLKALAGVYEVFEKASDSYKSAVDGNPEVDKRLDIFHEARRRKLERNAENYAEILRNTLEDLKEGKISVGDDSDRVVFDTMSHYVRKLNETGQRNNYKYLVEEVGDYLAQSFSEESDKPESYLHQFPGKSVEKRVGEVRSLVRKIDELKPGERKSKQSGRLVDKLASDVKPLSENDLNKEVLEVVKEIVNHYGRETAKSFINRSSKINESRVDPMKALNEGMEEDLEDEVVERTEKRGKQIYRRLRNGILIAGSEKPKKKRRKFLGIF
jgi:KaiC/GvpD/RAD55 family RecA-like ATPase